MPTLFVTLAKSCTQTGSVAAALYGWAHLPCCPTDISSRTTCNISRFSTGKHPHATSSTALPLNIIGQPRAPHRRVDHDCAFASLTLFFSIPWLRSDSASSSKCLAKARQAVAPYVLSGPKTMAIRGTLFMISCTKQENTRTEWSAEHEN